MRREGIEMIAPHTSRSKRKTQDGRGLRRYERRWIVERFFGSNGVAGYWFAGSTTRGTSLASCSSPPFASSSGNFKVFR